MKRSCGRPYRIVGSIASTNISEGTFRKKLSMQKKKEFS